VAPMKMILPAPARSDPAPTSKTKKKSAQPSARTGRPEFAAPLGAQPPTDQRARSRQPEMPERTHAGASALQKINRSAQGVIRCAGSDRQTTQDWPRICLPFALNGKCLIRRASTVHGPLRNPGQFCKLKVVLLRVRKERKHGCGGHSPARASGLMQGATSVSPIDRSSTASVNQTPHSPQL
jgi:hypothetical protein